MSNAHLYVAVRDAAAGTFDVLGELGAGQRGGVVYLAREIANDTLAVLKLEPDANGAGQAQYFLDVAYELDASVPDIEARCPRCRGKLRQWGRFCTQCGLDVSGEAPASGEHASRAALRDKVRAATAGQYEFLGDMPRSEGGGLVYFARDLSDGKIVALRLQKDMHKRFEVGVTRTLRAVERDASGAVPASARPVVTIVQRRLAQIPSTAPVGPAALANAAEAGAASSPVIPAAAQRGSVPRLGESTRRPPTGWQTILAAPRTRRAALLIAVSMVLALIVALSL